MISVVVWILVLINTQADQVSITMPHELYFATQSDCTQVRDKFQNASFIKAGCQQVRILVPKKG